MAAQAVEPWLEGRVRVTAVVTPESVSTPQHEWRHEQRSPQRELQSIHIGTDQMRIAGRLSGGKFEVPRLQSSRRLHCRRVHNIRNCDERTRLFRTNRVILPAVNENVIGGHPES